MANVGLVLSGGMAKGAYQIGALKAISEFFSEDSIKYISASSIGTLNAYAYATGKINVAENMWQNLKLEGIRTSFKTLVRKSYIFDAIDDFVSEDDSLENNLYTTCFNLSKAKLNYINLKEVEQSKMADYLKASVSVPAFSNPVDICGMKYIDGALVDNIPICPLIKYNLDYIIVVHFDNNSYTFENEYFDSKLIKINFLDDKIIKNSFSFDQNSISHMIDCGYEKSKSILEMVLKNGIDDVDYIYKSIKKLNTFRGDKSHRITGDVVVNNINKVLKKIVPKNM